MEGLGAALRWLMVLKTKPWHESEHYQHDEIDGTGNSVSAGEELTQSLALKSNSKAQLCND